MPQPEFSGLEDEVRELARRVNRLEKELGLGSEILPAAPATTTSAESQSAPRMESGALMPMAGRALLGLAGAYLLRALTEAGTLPPRSGVGIGILYAMWWLYLAARQPATRRIPAALNSLTAALVLAPLLWEGVLRFNAISTWAAAGLLAVFAVFALAVSWRKNLHVVATIAIPTVLATATALLLATHDVLPLTLVFLAIAILVEASACLDHFLSERWLAAAAANLSVLLATWLMTNQDGLPEGYAPIPHVWILAVQIALVAIYLSSTIVRTLLRGARFTVFEIMQCAAAFTITVSGELRLANKDPRAGLAIALFLIACGAACYLVSFVRLDHPGEHHDRNLYAYSTFGILLTLAGSWQLLSAGAAGALWPGFGVACAWAGGRFGRLTLQAHGAIYLLLALIGSGALARAVELVAGSAAWPVDRDVALVTGATAAICCYALIARYGRGRSEWNFGFLRLGTAATFVCLLAAVAAGLLTAGYHGVFGQTASHAYCATVRTAVTVAVALALAWAGSRWRMPELERLIYPAMAVGAYRLLMLDLHQDRTPALFLSLLVYGTGLIALPKVRRATGAVG
jgi:hypothetical protein